MAGDEHQFNRRSGDARIDALSTRVGILEERMSVIEENTRDNSRELRANTELTRQVHGAVFGRGEDPGMTSKVAEMHDVFSAAKGGFRVIELVGKAARPLLWTGLLVACTYGYFKTGEWHWPQ